MNRTRLAVDLALRELGMTLVALVLLGITLIVAVLGVFAFLIYWGRYSWKKYLIWDEIRKMWQPYRAHFWVFAAVWRQSKKGRSMQEILQDAIIPSFDDWCEERDRNEEARRQQKERHERPRRRQVYRPRRQVCNNYRVYTDPGDVFLNSFVMFEFGYILWILLYLLILALPVSVVTVQFRNAKPVQEPPTPAQVYVPSEIQQQEKDFGPWLTSLEADKLRQRSGVNNLMLINDTGTVRLSALYTVSSDDPAWQPSRSTRVESFKIDDTAVSFTDDRRNSYHLNLDQPFSFENLRPLIFIFTRDGLKQAKREQVKLIEADKYRSNAKPNPALSR